MLQHVYLGLGGFKYLVTISGKYRKPVETKLKLSDDLCRLNTISEINKALSHNSMDFSCREAEYCRSMIDMKVKCRNEFMESFML